MSGIYIPGMEMPKMLAGIKQGDKVPYIDVRIFADGSAVTSKGERPYFTEYKAVPVPDHGRLIDADALRHTYYHAPSFPNLCKAINEAPTVIPASKEEEG